MQTKSSSRLARWIGLIVVIVAVTLVAVWSVGVRAMRMQTAAAASDNDQLAKAQPGSQLKAVVELTSTGDGKAEGLVLDKHSENAYRRSNRTMQIDFAPATKFVMGSAGDLRKGAVLHVTGTVAQNRRLEASQIVILTGYVSVD
jgi:hypothetical protein